MQPDELKYVGFWARFSAFLIDHFLLIVLLTLIVLTFNGMSRWIGSHPIMQGAMGLVLTLFPIVTTIRAWVSKQATLGKTAISAKIIDARTGDTPSTGQFVGRYFAYIISALPFLLGFIWVAFDSRKQGWHDKIAGTVVVRQKKRNYEGRSNEGRSNEGRSNEGRSNEGRSNEGRSNKGRSNKGRYRGSQRERYYKEESRRGRNRDS